MSAAPTTAISRDPATGRQIASHPLPPMPSWKQSSIAARSALRPGASRAWNSAQTYCVRWPPYCAETVRSWPRWPLPKWARSAEALAEIEKCAVLCDWYADHGAQFLRDEPTQVPDDKAYVSYLPLGVVLGIMPWNFPYWQVMRAAVPILMAVTASC